MKQAWRFLAAVCSLAASTTFAAQTPEENAFEESRQVLYGNNLATGVTVTASSSLPSHPASAALELRASSQREFRVL